MPKLARNKENGKRKNLTVGPHCQHRPCGNRRGTGAMAAPHRALPSLLPRALAPLEGKEAPHDVLLLLPLLSPRAGNPSRPAPCL